MFPTTSFVLWIFDIESLATSDPFGKVPFKSAIAYVQNDRVVTGCMVVPSVRILKTEYIQYTMAPEYEAHDAFQTTSILDPRYKPYWCIQSEGLI